MLSVRLPKKTEERLAALSARTHRSKSYYIKKALDQFLEDEEDYAALVDAYEEHLRTKGKSYSLEQMKTELDLG